jgi:hypothetical protein
MSQLNADAFIYMHLHEAAKIDATANGSSSGSSAMPSQDTRALHSDARERYA